MTEAKFPVVACVNGQQSFKWMTLEQANERFVVVNGLLVVNNVEPLSLEYCSFLLDCVKKALNDSEEEISDLCSDIEHFRDNNERLFLEYLQPKIDKIKKSIKIYEAEMDFLNKAIVFLKS